MQDFPLRPDRLNLIWAKSPRLGQPTGEFLITHTQRVVERFSDLAALRPDLPAIADCPTFWNALFWAAFLHDWGKVAHGFQAGLRGGPRWAHRHEVLSIGFLPWFIGAMTSEEETWATLAILSHHRDMAELETLYPLGLPDEVDPILDLVAEVSSEDLEALFNWAQQVLPSWSRESALAHLGIRFPAEPIKSFAPRELLHPYLRKQISTRLSHAYQRVGSLSFLAEPFPLWLGIFLRGCLMEADWTGSAHTPKLPKLALTKDDGNGQRAISALIGLKAPYFHQKEAAQVENSAILTAPTGSGKTEAALLWAANQAKQGRAARLFYTLPYQASMNAMHNRLEQLFPGQVGLLHGRSLLALYRQLLQDDEDLQHAAYRAKWESNLSALRHQPIQVSSPYQMLKAAFQLKGYEILLADYAQSAFIFDEIHAYEPGRLAMILEFIRLLQEKLEARFFLMSATFPKPILDRAQSALGNPHRIVASQDLYQRFARHRVIIQTGDLLPEKGISLAKRFLQQGQSVLIVCNTVTRAQEVYRLLLDSLSPEVVVLVHGRFCGRDRLEKERRILSKTGLQAHNRSPMIVVSTQVVEVSLNIDLDIMISDPAPLEALLQRMGRVNRQRRVEAAPIYIFSEPADGQGIYWPELIQASLQSLNEIDGRIIDEASVQIWLDHIYTGPILQKWEEQYDKTAREFRRAFLDSMRPFSSDDRLSGQFDKLFDGLEILPVSLESDYRLAREELPLEASQYLVPISWGRWCALKKSGLVLSQDWPPIVNVPYSSETGLMTTQTQTEE